MALMLDPATFISCGALDEAATNRVEEDLLAFEAPQVVIEHRAIAAS
jgi:hypothetical protein